jgi:hypothetical protein
MLAIISYLLKKGTFLLKRYHLIAGFTLLYVIFALLWMRTGNDILSTLLRHSIGQVEIEAFTEYIYIYFTAVSLYLLLLIAL